MEKARDRATGEILDAVELAKGVRRDPGIRGTYRGRLECLGCKADAVFTAASKNGRAAHFRADHDPVDCDHGRQRIIDETAGHLEDDEEPRTNENVIPELRIDPAGGTPSEGRVTDDPHAGPAAPQGSSTRNGPAEGENARTIGLRSLLANLRDAPGSYDTVTYDGDKIPIVHWDSVEKNSPWMGRKIILWGRIYSARDFRQRLIYLNQGPKDENRAAIVIDYRDEARLIQAHGKGQATLLSHFRGWYVIAVGETHPLFDGGLGLKVDIDHLALIP